MDHRVVKKWFWEDLRMYVQELRENNIEIIISMESNADFDATNGSIPEIKCK